MLEKIRQLWTVRDIRRNLLFVLGLLVIFRVTAHIPVPGVDVQGLRNFFGSNQVLGLLNIFSGGALENFSVVMLGVGPYITASIIIQLLTMIVPRLEEISKEGEQGRQRINHYTRILAVPMAILQSYGTITLLQRSGGLAAAGGGTANVIGGLTPFQFITAMVTITAGSMFLMWLGELISEKQVGNGISLVIFAGIVAQLPVAAQRYLSVFDSSQVFTTLVFLAVALVTVAGVVFITEATRNIPVTYARRIRGIRTVGGSTTHLPLRINQAGVIPIIFAISIVIFPPIIAQFFITSGQVWLANAAQFTITLFNNQIFYAVFYFVLVVVFTFFYTAIVFHPEQISENLQKQGGFIPGIRPGPPTAQYLSYVTNRILLAGALFLGLIAILPTITQGGQTGTGIAIGGTSLLIVVSVVIETVKKIESQLTMRDYEGFSGS